MPKRQSLRVVVFGVGAVLVVAAVLAEHELQVRVAPREAARLDRALEDGARLRRRGTRGAGACAAV